MPQPRRRAATVLRCLVLATVLVTIPAARALASTTQTGWMQDDPSVLADPMGTLERMRLLGAEEVRFGVRWYSIAPNINSHRAPRGFNGANPASYFARAWAPLDAVVRDAQQLGIGLDLDLMGGAPLWATGPNPPHDGKLHYNWEPSPSLYGQFVRAVATRYSGNYDPRLKKLKPGDPNDLPRVNFWSIWNEPDYGPSLAPQGLPSNLRIDYAPDQYRHLVDAAWSAFQATGHGRDTIVFGEVAPRGQSYWGVFSGMTPLLFLRSLYCVDSHYRQLRGSAAAVRGCPTTAAGSRGFRAAHPALFQASGFSDHPYMRWYPPNHEVNPDPTNHLSTADYTSLGVIGQLERALDRLQGVYGSHTRFPIYDTEFSYITSPPKHDTSKAPYVSPATAAYYINWAEYLSWRDPRMQSFDQYLLYDPLPALKSNDWGQFASGLLTYGRHLQKADYSAFRLPLYLPVASTRRGRSLEVWGCMRPARFALEDSTAPVPQTGQIQFQRGSSGPWTTLQTITITNPNNCYFDVRVVFPASGSVRLVWSYPSLDPMLGDFAADQTHPVYSRRVAITIH